MGFAVLGILLLVLGACESLGEDHPFNRKFNWFDHLGGADIRAACQPDRYRFIYNGIYMEQVRSYDILATNQPDFHRFKVAVAEEADLRDIITVLGRPDIFQPWRPRIESRVLSTDVVRNMNTVLAGDGFFTSKLPKGAFLLLYATGAYPPTWKEFSFTTYMFGRPSSSGNWPFPIS